MQPSFIFKVKCEGLKFHKHSNCFLAQIHVEKLLNKEKRSAGLVITCDYNQSSPIHVIVMEQNSELILLPTSSKVNRISVPDMIIGTSDSRIIEREAPLVYAKGTVNAIINQMDSLRDDRTDIMLNSSLLIRGSSSCFEHMASYHLPQMSLICSVFIDELVVL